MEAAKTEKEEEFLVNDRFMLVMDHLVEIRKCRNYADFWEQLGYSKNLPQRTQKIKNHLQKVTITLLLQVGSKFGVNINYLLGFEEEIFRK